MTENELRILAGPGVKVLGEDVTTSRNWYVFVKGGALLYRDELRTREEVLAAARRDAPHVEPICARAVKILRP